METNQIQHRIQNKCINLLTTDGKKTKAYSLFNAALTLVIKKTRNLPKTHLKNSQDKQFLTLRSLEFKTQKSILNTQEHITKGSKFSDWGKAHSIFQQSIENVKPVFEVRKVRIAGNTLLVPALISFQRQENKALRWIIEGAKERKKKSSKLLFEECLALEIIEASEQQGYAKHKRDELHKIAEANRAFSHYKWW